MEWSTPNRYSTEGRWFTVALPVTWQSRADCLVGVAKTAISLSTTTLPVWAAFGTAVGAARVTTYAFSTSLTTSFSTIFVTGTSLMTSFSIGTSLMISFITSFSTTMGSAVVPPQAARAIKRKTRGVMMRNLGSISLRYDMRFPPDLSKCSRECFGRYSTRRIA